MVELDSSEQKQLAEFHGEHSCNMLSEAMRYNLTFVGYNPGNKSGSMITEYLSAVEYEVWGILTKADVSVRHFWKYFISAVSTWSLHLSTRLQAMEFPATLPEKERLWDLLLQTKEEYGKPVFILICSHYYTRQPVREFLAWLIEHNDPPFLSIILSYDSPPPVLPDSLQPVYVEFRNIILSRHEISFIIQNWLQTAVNKAQLDQMQAITGGWAPAVRFIRAQLLSGFPLSEQVISRAVSDIYEALDHEFFCKLAPSAQKSLILLSFPGEFSLSMMETLTSMTREEFSRITRRMPFFLYHASSGTYTMQPVLQNFLASRQGLLSHRHRMEFFTAMGAWHEAKHSLTEPFEFYLKANDYSRIIHFLQSIDILAIPYKIYIRYDQLLDQIPSKHLDEYPILYIYRILMSHFLNLPIKRKTAKRCLIAAVYAKKEMGSSADLTALGECYLLVALDNRIRGRRFLLDLEQASRYLPNGSQIFAEGTHSFIGLTSALPLGGSLSMQEIVEQHQLAAPYMAIVMKNYGRGVEHLVKCEASFYQGSLEEALHHATRAIQVASEARQWDIAALASFFSMRVYIATGGWEAMNSCRLACISYVKRDERQAPGQFSLADLASSVMYYIMGIRTLYTDRIDVVTDTEHQDGGKLQSIWDILTKTLNGNEKFYEVLNIINTAISDCTGNELWIYKLYLKLFRTTIYLQLNHPERAIRELEHCYQLSHKDNIITPFAEFGAGMRKLMQVARLHPNLHSIPEEWLREVEKLSATFETGMKKIRREYFQSDIPFVPELPLTKRERQAYTLLCNDLKISQIAMEMEISESTVRVVLSRVYKKLGVKNQKEAVRLAKDG